MKKIVLLLIGLLFLSGTASAYSVMIDAPDTLAVGKPLIVTGTTTLGIGTPVDVVLYFQLTTTTEVQRKIVYIQSDRTFQTFFDTTGLKKGTYKVEVPVNGGGDSVTMRVVHLVDRTDEIFLTSPTTQNLKATMYVAGTIKGDENSGVQIEVIGSDGTPVFGPRYINTNFEGDFSADIPITQPGDYEISFTDAKGYIGVRTVTIISESNQPLPASTTAKPLTVASAHAPASQGKPAYFLVKTGSRPVTIYTSASVNWVLEYSDGRGAIQIVNDMGEINPEKVDLPGKAGTTFVKVYPYSSSVNSVVFLYAENALSVTASPTVPAPFAAGEPSPASTQKSPLMPLLAAAGAGIAALVARRTG